MTLHLEQLIERLEQAIQQLKALEPIFTAIIQEQKSQSIAGSGNETGAASNASIDRLLSSDHRSQ